MKIHLGVERPGPFGGTLTTTLCRRMNAQSQDGMNSTEHDAEVTCKFCLRMMKTKPARSETKGEVK